MYWITLPCFDHWCDESIIHVHEVVDDDQRNEDMLRGLLPEELVEYILENVQPRQYILENVLDNFIMLQVLNIGVMSLLYMSMK